MEIGMEKMKCILDLQIEKTSLMVMQPLHADVNAQRAIVFSRCGGIAVNSATLYPFIPEAEITQSIYYRRNDNISAIPGHSI